MTIKTQLYTVYNLRGLVTQKNELYYSAQQHPQKPMTKQNIYTVCLKKTGLLQLT